MKELMIRDIEQKDFDFVLRVNRENVEVLSPMDEEKLKRFVDSGELVKIAEIKEDDGRCTPAAFIIALRENVSWYDSENYIWFSSEYPKFLYIDRVVIDEPFRYQGVGSDIYDYVFNHASSTGVPTVTAEIDTIPYNEASLKFHEKTGFKEVGTQFVRGGTIKVSLQARPIINL